MIRVKFEGSFDSHNVKRDGVVKLSFKVPLSELPEVVQTMRLIDKQASMGLVCGAAKIPVGRVVFDRLSFDRDGEARVVFQSDVDNLRLSEENLRALVDSPIIVILRSAGG